MFAKEGVGKVIAQRLASLVDADSAWHDQLWQVGTLRAMQDCIDLVESHATAARVQYVVGTARRSIENDPVLSGRRRGQVLSSLPRKADQFQAGTHSFFVLKHEIEQLVVDYFDLWHNFVSSLDEDEDPFSTQLDLEVVSCYIAGHLRWCDLSDKWILKHCNYYLKHCTEDSSLATILATAARVVGNGKGKYTYLIPLSSDRKYDHESQAPWLSKDDFDTEFVAFMPETPVPDHTGGLIFQVYAVEKYRAAELFAKELHNTLARGRLVNKVLDIESIDGAWMHPGSARVDLPDIEAASFSSLRSLNLAGDRWTLRPLPARVEAGLDLLSTVGTVSVRSACVAIWTMVETMFADASDFGSLGDISDRPADLLACMYVTGLFDKLASSHEAHGHDALAHQLSSEDLHGRVELIVAALLAQASIAVDRGHGPILLQQARKFVAGPHQLALLRTEFSESLRRLYGSRNEIVHAGVLAPHAIRENVHVATKLLAAVMDEAVRNACSSPEPIALVAAKCRWLMNRVEIGADIAGLAAYRPG
ncbi:hypothetical protein [Nocardia brasiliensis]